MLKVRKKSRPA